MNIDRVLKFVVFCGVTLAGQLVFSQAPDFYDPIPMALEGWTVSVDPKLMDPANRKVQEKAFAALSNHLQRIKFILPQEKVDKLQQLKIWLELDHPVLKNMQYHPSRGWLQGRGFDPRLAKHVHITQAKSLYARHMWAKHPYVVLHELAHAYHDQVLGFGDEQIRRQFERVADQGIYENVLFHSGRKGKHYGLSNHKEYFAESTEAYLGVNDFYPFVRSELKEHDPGMYALMSKIWGPIRR